MMMTNVELMKAHLAAFSSNNWEEYERNIADNVSYEELASRTMASGRTEYIENAKRWKRAFPDLRADVRTIFGINEYVIAEVEWVGTHKGTLESPLGELPATGKRERVRAVLITRFSKGKITESRQYFDMLGVLSTLGALEGHMPQSVQRLAGQARSSAV